MELCMTGRRISPEEAERLGLVTAVYEPEALMPAVMAFANDLAAKPPLAISNIKKAIHAGSSMTMQDGLILERKLFFESLRSDDAINIMRLYVAAGQDQEKLLAMVEKVGPDPEKIAELLAKEKE
jgi:enoyl-CoA hydratase